MATNTRIPYIQQFETSQIRRNQDFKTIHTFLTSIFLSMLLVLQVDCQSLPNTSSKKETNNISLNSLHHIINDLGNKTNIKCHNCSGEVLSNQNNDNTNHDRASQHSDKEIISPANSISAIGEILDVVKVFNNNFFRRRNNETVKKIEEEVLKAVDHALSKDTYLIAEGVKIELAPGASRELFNENHEERAFNALPRSARRTTTAVQDSFGFNEKFFERIKQYARNHVLSINIPNAARLFSFRSFGLKKLLLPIFIGAQVVKSVLIAMFLPSILGSLGKIVGKGLSQISTSSSQASFPPAGLDGVDPYNKELMGYQLDQDNAYAYPLPNGQDQDQYTTGNDVNDLSDVGLSRYGPGGAKVTYVPTKSDNYYKNHQANTNYKVFHKIPASSMILSNYDPFYSPLLSRLDGIFSRLGLAPGQGETEEQPHVAGQSLSHIKLESCREQLICLMYASPAKYAPYSNLVSAQLSRELNELRRPTSDNAEILRFFRYMRAARRGQEGGAGECARAHATCGVRAEPEHTMIAAYHDINKLVTARKLHL